MSGASASVNRHQLSNPFSTFLVQMNVEGLRDFTLRRIEPASLSRTEF